LKDNGKEFKDYKSFLRESEESGDVENTSEFSDCLPYLKRVRNEIPWQTVLQWFNQNDIEYSGMSDLDMYIHYIEKNF